MTLVRLVPTSEHKHVLQIWNPPADIVEGPDGFSITIDLPGFEKDDVKILVKDGVLRVSGERKCAEFDNEHYFHHYERPAGSFSRGFRLPDFIDGEKIHATYEKGVLTLNLLKKEEAKPHTIEIK